MVLRRFCILLVPTVLAAPMAFAQQTVGYEAQGQACAVGHSMMPGVEMSQIRVNGFDEARAGNTVIVLQTADDRHAANCEVDDHGTVVAIERIRD